MVENRILDTKKKRLIQLRTAGFTDSQIMKRLQLTDGGLAKYQSEINTEAGQWIRSFHEDRVWLMNFRKNLMSLQTDIDVMESQIKLIRKQIKADPTDTGMLHALNNAVAIHSKLCKEQWELINKTPMVVSHNKFIEDNIVKKTEKKEGDDKLKGHMPLVPPGV